MKRAPPSDRRFFFGVGDRSAASARALAREFAARGGGSEADLLFPLFLPPSVLAIAPTSGPTAGGTAVTISGANFRPGATVLIGGVLATGVVVNGPTSISCNTPAHASGAVTVRVTNVDGQSGRLINGYTYVDPFTVAVGTNNAATTIDGINWTARAIPAGTWASVAYGGGLYVAVSSNGRVTTSPDGINWSASQAVDAPNGFVNVSYGNGVFVAMTQNGRASSSPDGVTWQTVFTGTSSVDSMTFGGGIFVAGGGGGGWYWVTSNDGIHWASSNPAGAAVQYGFDKSLAYDGSKYVGVASNLYGQSANGLSWAETAFAFGSFDVRLAYGGGRFVVVRGAGGGLTTGFWSADGSTWNATGDLGAQCTVVGYSPTLGLFIAAGTQSSTSPDGNTWTLRNSLGFLPTSIVAR